MRATKGEIFQIKPMSTSAPQRSSNVTSMIFEKLIEDGAGSPNRSMSEIASALGAIIKGGRIFNQTTEIIFHSPGEASLQ